MTLDDTRGDAHALLETLTDALAEVKELTLGDRRGDAHALVDTLADALAGV